MPTQHDRIERERQKRRAREVWKPPLSGVLPDGWRQERMPNGLLRLIPPAPDKPAA